MDPRHRQFDPMFVLERSRRFLKEASATLKRRSEGKAEDVWLRSRLYPEYYMNTWHYQTDGWLSSTSAGVYETSTETLFLGQQDAMQRTTLVKDNFPDATVTCLDMSPFYLQEARDNFEHWCELRGDTQGSAPGAEFLQAPAEDIPAEDGSYDAITCVYLFHEIT